MTSNTDKLKKYLSTLEEKKCPINCIFNKKEKNNVIIITPPSNISGIIISRDPTVNFGHFYEYIKNQNQILDDNSRKMLYSSAIPLDLLNKISIFMEGLISEKERLLLYNIIYQNTYWTHLQKCYPGSYKEKTNQFKIGVAKKCANKLLRKELTFILDNKIKFLIALGRNVQTWINADNEIIKNIEIINLPHPSGHNNPIWYRSSKKKYFEQIKYTNEQVFNLIKLIM